PVQGADQLMSPLGHLALEIRIERLDLLDPPPMLLEALAVAPVEGREEPAWRSSEGEAQRSQRLDGDHQTRGEAQAREVGNRDPLERALPREEVGLLLVECDRARDEAGV